MAKYAIYLILIAIVALNHCIIYGRQHSHAQQTASHVIQNTRHYVRPQYNNQRFLHAQTSMHSNKRTQQNKSYRQSADKTRHIRQTSWQENVPPDAMTHAEEKREREEAAAALRRYIHMERHIARQQEHLLHHPEEYHRTVEQTEIGAVEEIQAQKQVQSMHNTPLDMRMPRIWQHLGGGTDDLMLADAPLDGSAESKHISIPLEQQEINETDELDDLLPHAQEADSNLLEDEVKEHKTATSGCPKCESSRSVQHISEEELTQLRIEYVKQQILEKLRLKAPPNVSAVALPKPIYEGTTIEEERDDSAKNKDLDDYYARTSKKFIFLQREKLECQRLGTNSSMCFSFKIDDADADGFDVSTAVLWLYKSRTKRWHRYNSTREVPQTIVVSEVQENTDPEYMPIVKTIAIQSIDAEDEWMKIDIEWPIKRWFGNHDLSHLIQVTCRTCDMAKMERMISLNKDYRPFIMVDTQNRRRASRRKRSINCTDGVTECCREKLYISFDDIGWGDWIIQPRGYDAYFCRGSCGSVASVTQSATHHSAFLQKVALSRRNHGSKPLELIPCCTAKQYSSLQLVFMDSNNTATQKTFPNMVIESCGCR
ncbi:growth/differentiation factor 8 [Eurosta solidaginis]|uniref:growth/differentiation factor 8 n=1 Tax=Eurosta solidaginis TaxID=178769 RepID=UPI0035314FAF